MHQGPCSANQEFIILGSRAVVFVKQILSASIIPHASANSQMQLKAGCVKLLAACLEGQHEQDIPSKLAGTLEIPMLRAVIDAFQKHTAVDAMVDLSCLIQNLQRIPAFLKSSKESKLDISLDGQIGTIDVFWMGRCELVTFPLPPGSNSLQQTSKAAFLEAVDYSTRDARVRALVECSDDLIAEMNHLHKLHNVNLFRRAVPFLGVLQLVLFALVMLLNLDMITSSNMVLRDYESETLDLAIDSTMSVVLILGYAVLLFFSCFTEVPIYYHKLRNSMDNAKLRISMDDATESGRNSSFTSFFSAGAFFACVVVLDYTKFGPQSWHGILFSAIFVPWFIVALRSWFDIPDTEGAFLFAFFYDILTGALGTPKGQSVRNVLIVFRPRHRRAGWCAEQSTSRRACILWHLPAVSSFIDAPTGAHC